MIAFVDKNSNPLPCTVAVDPAKGILDVYAVDDSGIPVVCDWTLRNASKWGSSYWGTLQGFTTSQVYVDVINLYGLTSATYQCPDPTLYKGKLSVILTATSTTTGKQRQIQIAVQHNIENEFSS